MIWVTRTLLSVCLLLALPMAAHASLVNEAAPNFILLNLAGESVALADQRGKPVLLEVGTTWCPGCRVQSNEVNKVRDHFGYDKLAVLKVFIQETADSVRSYLEDTGGRPESALLDDDTVRDRYAIYLIPRVLVIGPDGKVAFDGGLTEADAMIETIEALQVEATR